MNLGLQIEIGLLALMVIVLIVYLLKNRQKIHIQPIIKFGKFNILSIALVRTGWGLKLMDTWSKKYNEWVKLFGLVSIGIGFVGILIMFASLISMIVMLIKSPSTTQVSLVLPFTDIPGLGYLAFSHWLIAIFVLATVHEFAHGVVARAYSIPVKNSGFAVLKLFYVPVVPAAFVEPDEKLFPKRSDVEQYSVLTAGPVSNILLAIPFLLISLFIFAPLTNHMTEPTGFSFATVTPNMSASMANVTPYTTYNYVNGKLANDSNEFYRQLWFNTLPGQELTLGYYNYSSAQLTKNVIKTNVSPTDPTLAFVGIAGTTNVLDFKSEYKKYEKVFNWFKELFRICFMFNLLVGLFNLMPLFVTDGGQIMRVFSNKLYAKNKEKAKRMHSIICSICFYILLAALIIPLFF